MCCNRFEIRAHVTQYKIFEIFLPIRFPIKQAKPRNSCEFHPDFAHIISYSKHIAIRTDDQFIFPKIFKFHLFYCNKFMNEKQTSTS